MALLRHDQECWFILWIKFPYGTIFVQFYYLLFPKYSSSHNCHENTYPKSSVGFSLIT